MQNKSFLAIIFLLITASSCTSQQITPATSTSSTSTLRPIHWWVGGREYRADCKTSNLVTSWTINYDGKYNKSNETKRLLREVGGTTSIDEAIGEIKNNYAQGARTLATDHENWERQTTLNEAETFVTTINSREGLTVVQWNSFYTWVPEAIPVIENNPKLLLMEMIYPTCEGLRTYKEIYDNIIWYLSVYTVGKKPGIGLSVYYDKDMTKPISWELMKIQIDAAKAVGLKEFGSSRHPIGVFIADVETTEFTVDDVNNYIIYGTRTP